MHFVVPFLISFVAVAALTPLVRWFAGWIGVVARPKNDRWHRRTVPLLGGVAIWAGTVIAVLSTGGGHRDTWTVLVAGSVLFGLGLADDLRGVRPMVKVIVQIAVACGLVATGTVLPWAASPGLNALITVFWVVGMANAFNLLDNMDGLCAGIAAITACALCWTLAGSSSGALLGGAALAGAAAGFLIYNFNPASIFMGDAGSMFLGGTLAVLAVSGEARAQRGVLSALAVPVLLMLIPIFDTTFVTLTRKLSMRQASVGGRDHTSHRLVAMGFSERQAVGLLCGLAGVSGAAAIGLSSRAFREVDVLLALLVIGLLLLGVRLARVKVYDGEDFSVLRARAFTPLLVDVTYKRRIFEILLDVCLVSLSYYASWIIRFDKDFVTYYGAFVQSLPLLITCQIGSLYLAGVYGDSWDYLSLTDVPRYVRGVALGAASSALLVLFVNRFEGFSRGVFVIHTMALVLLLLGSRASFRVLGELAGRHGTGSRRAIIYGAGIGASILVRELRSNPTYNVRLVGFLDDAPGKTGTRMLGLRVLGGLDQFEQVVAQHRPDLVILSTGKIDGTQLERVTQACYATGTALQRFNLQLEDVPLSARDHRIVHRTE